MWLASSERRAVRGGVEGVLGEAQAERVLEHITAAIALGRQQVLAGVTWLTSPMRSASSRTR